jgi:hypothetical protein
MGKKIFTGEDMFSCKGICLMQNSPILKEQSGVFTQKICQELCRINRNLLEHNNMDHIWISGMIPQTSHIAVLM